MNAECLKLTGGAARWSGGSARDWVEIGPRACILRVHVDVCAACTRANMNALDARARPDLDPSRALPAD